MSAPTTYTTKEGITFVRETFIRDYAVQFAAAYTAQHYVEFCQRGLQDQLGRPPWEDALLCAAEAWDHLTIAIQP